MDDDNLADELKLREKSPFHGGLTAVAHKANRDVCWVCFDPIGAQFVDLPMKEAWIRICTKPECEKAALREPMGETDGTKAIRSVVPTQIKADLKSLPKSLNVPKAVADIMRRK